MAKKEAKTDLWVAKQLDEAGLDGYDPQGSTVLELDEALKTASKSGSGKVGFPEYVAVVHDFVLVIEDKSSLNLHVKLTDSGVLDMTPDAVRRYGLNGAYHYAKHIATKSPFKKVFAVAVSGDEKHHTITPLYVDDREGYKQLPDIESFIWFNRQNIREYYTRYVLDEATDVEKTTKEILRDAADLHEKLRTFGTLKDQDKPLVVSGILLALDEVQHGNFNIESLQGGQLQDYRDGDKIMAAVKARLSRSNVGPDAKRDKLLSEFSVITNSVRLNEINPTLGKTPLKYYTEFLYRKVFQAIKYQQTSEDFIGRFYGEFMSYSGGDGQSLGIILTPRHITDLMVDLVEVGPNDIVFDPTCGTGGFLISAMHKMLGQADTSSKRRSIKKTQLHGYELQSNMFAIAATNMILRGDGNSNIQAGDFLAQNAAQVQLKRPTVGLMNPPYSQGKDDPSQFEMLFVEHLLDCMVSGGRVAVIIPQSSVSNKSAVETRAKERILRKHTLDGVITCNTETFYGVGTNVVIAVFTAGEPHEDDHIAKFIDFRDDGYEVKPHIGLMEGDSAKDKRHHLLEVWTGRLEAPSRFCVYSTVKASDEWLHGCYYFNDEVPARSAFEEVVGNYLAFQFLMTMQNREYLFPVKHTAMSATSAPTVPIELSDADWAPFSLPSVFDEMQRGKRLKSADQSPGLVPYVSSSAENNGVDAFIEAVDGTRVFEDCLSLANSGSVGMAFYEPFAYVASDHVTKLKRSGASEAEYLFLATMVMQQRMNFSFNREINDSRLRLMQIMLPVKESGEPDYDFMDAFMQQLIDEKRAQYIQFLSSSGETQEEA